MFLPAIADVDNRGQYLTNPVLTRLSGERHEKRRIFLLGCGEAHYRLSPMFSTGYRRCLNELSTGS
jgi:hypothetical protein